MSKITSPILLIIIIIFNINILILYKPLFAAEYLSDEQPAPDSVKGLSSPLSNAFRIIPGKEALFPNLRDYLKNLPPVVRDMKLYLNVRSYYFYRQNTNDTESTAWALGGSIFYESGKLFNLISVGGEVFTSQKLYGPEDKDSTLLLKPGQEGFTVIGRAYGNINYKDKFDIKLYRQYVDSPYVNKQDNRMVPNTFEAYILRSDLGVFKLGGGYISKIKRRNNDEFVPMSEIGGIDDVDNGMYLIGALYSPVDEFSIGGINYFVENVINIFYAESHFLKTTGSGIGIKVSAQLTDQRSVGDDLLGSDFSTQVWGGQIAASYLNTILRTAFSATSSDKEIISPYGGYPGYISLIVNDFNRAGEKAFLIGISHNVKNERLKGLSFFTNYAIGYDARDVDNQKSLPNEREFDFTVDYKPENLIIRGLWLRIRYANVDFSGNENSINDFRVILNYNLPVL